MKMQVRHVLEKRGRYYFNPTKAMKAVGFHPEPLGADQNAAMRRAATLNAEWDALRKGAVDTRETAGSLGWLMTAFVKDPVYYGDKSSATKDEIDYVFKLLRGEGWGDVLVVDIERKHCRELYRRLRESGSDHRAARVMKYFARLMRFAIDEGLRGKGDNPAIKLGITSPEARDVVWTPEEVAHAIDVAIGCGRRSLALLIAIAYDCGQRPQDVRTALWSDREAEGIYYKQGKTGARVWAALSPLTLSMLEETPKEGEHIVRYEGTGRPYADKDQLGKQWRKVREAAQLWPELRLADLRRTAATEAGNAGATETELDAVHGWKPGSRVHGVYIRPGKDASRRLADKRWRKE